MKNKLLKIIAICFFIILLSLSACVSRPKIVPNPVTEKLFDNTKVTLKEGVLSFYIYDKDVKTAVFEISGLNTSSKQCRAFEDRLEFYSLKKGIYSLFSSKREGDFENGSLVAQLKTSLTTLDNLRLTTHVSKKTAEKPAVSTNVRNIQGNILGDYNNDYVVDLKDFETFVDNFGKEKGEYKIFPATDSDGDGIYDTLGQISTNVLNEEDFTIFANNYAMGNMLELIKNDQYTMASEIAKKIIQRKPEYPLSYLTLFMEEWKNCGGFEFFDRYDNTMGVVLRETVNAEENVIGEAYDFFINTAQSMDKIHEYLGNILMYWPENLFVDLDLSGVDRILNYGKEDFTWILTHLNLFRTFSSFFLSYDLYGNYKEIISKFNTINPDTGTPLVDSDGNKVVTPEEIYNILPENFGKLLGGGSENLEKMRVSLDGISDYTTVMASEVLSDPIYFDYVATPVNFIHWDIQKRYKPEYLNFKGLMEYVWGNRETFENDLKNLANGQNAVINFILPSNDQQISAREVAQDLTINLSSFFSAQIDNLKKLITPTLECTITYTENEAVKFTTSFAFKDLHFDTIFPNGDTEIPGFFTMVSKYLDYLASQDPNPNIVYNYRVDQSIWVEPPAESQKGYTFEVYGVDGLPVEGFVISIFDIGIRDNITGGSASYENLPEGEYSVYIDGCSQNKAEIDGKRFNKSFFWADKVDFTLGEGENGKTFKIYAANISKNLKFNVKDLNGNIISPNKDMRIMLLGDSETVFDYVHPFNDFYHSGEWVKIKLDRIRLIDVQVKNDYLQLFDENEHDIVNGSDHQIDIFSSKNSEIIFETDKLGEKVFETVYFMPSHWWYWRGSSGFNFENYAKIDLTANREYRISYAFMKQNMSTNEYYDYTCRITLGDKDPKAKVYIPENKVYTVDFTDNCDIDYSGLISKDNYNVGELLEGIIYIKDENNNFIDGITKYEKKAEALESLKKITVNNYDIEGNQSRNFNWNDYEMKYQVDPVFEVQNTNGITIFSAIGKNISYRLPYDLKPGYYTLLFRWDTGSLAGVLQKTKRIYVGDKTGEFSVVPELWIDRNENNRQDGYMMYVVNMFDLQKWEDYESYVNGPNIDSSDPAFVAGKGLQMVPREHEGEKLFIKYTFIDGKWPSVGEEYTVDFYNNGNKVESMKYTLNFVFNGIPQISTPQNNSVFDSLKDINLIWNDLPGAEEYQIRIMKVNNANDEEQVFEKFTSSNSIILPKNNFEMDKKYRLYVKAHRNVQSEWKTNSKAENYTEVVFGKVDDFKTTISGCFTDGRRIDDGYFCRVDFFNASKLEKLEHIWVSGIRVEGGQFDLVELDYNDSPSVFEAVGPMEYEDKLQVGDTFRMTFEYSDGNSEFQDILVVNVDANFANIVNPVDLHKYDSVQDVNVIWNCDSVSSSERGIEKRYFDVWVWNSTDENRNWDFTAHYENIMPNESNSYSLNLPSNLFNINNKYSIVVTENVVYDNSPNYIKNVSKQLDIIFGDVQPYEEYLDINYFPFRQPSYEIVAGVVLKNWIEPDSIDKVEFIGPDIPCGIMGFFEDWGQCGEYRLSHFIDNPQENTYTIKIYFKNGEVHEIEKNLSFIPTEAVTITSPGYNQIFNYEAGLNIPVTWQGNSPDGNFAMRVMKDGVHQWIAPVTSPYDVGELIYNLGEGYYTIRVITCYPGEESDAFAEQETKIVVGNPPLYDQTLLVRNMIRDGNEEDDYFDLIGIAEYYIPEMADDVRQISMSDDKGRSSIFNKDNQNSLSGRYELDGGENPFGLEVQFDYEYQNYQNSSDSYVVDSIFDTHPQLVSPLDNSTVSLDQNLYVEFQQLEGVDRYDLRLWYMDGNWRVFVESQNLNHTENSYIFDSSVFSDFGDGVYMIEVVAISNEDRTQYNSSERGTDLNGYEYLTYKDGDSWKKAKLIDGKPETPVKISKEDFAEHLFRFETVKRDTDIIKGRKNYMKESYASSFFMVGENTNPFRVSGNINYNLKYKPEYFISIFFNTKEFVNSITQAYVEGPVINGRSDFTIAEDQMESMLSIQGSTDTFVPGDEYNVIIQTENGIAYSHKVVIPEYPRDAKFIDYQTNLVDNCLELNQDLAVSWRYLPHTDHARIVIWKVDEAGKEHQILFRDYDEGNSTTIESGLFDDGQYFMEIHMLNHLNTGMHNILIFDRIPFLVGDTKDFNFSMLLIDRGSEFEDRWYTRLETIFFGAFSADDVLKVEFDGPLFVEPKVHRFVWEFGFSGDYQSEDGLYGPDYQVQSGEEYTATIYAKPGTQLANWFKMKNPNNSLTSRDGDEIVYATDSILIGTVPGEFEIVKPEDGKVYLESEDIQLEWEVLPGANGYYVRVEQYDYLMNNYQGVSWECYLDGQQTSTVIPEYTMKNDHSYRIRVESYENVEGPYRYISSDVISIKVGEYIIKKAQFEYEPYALGEVGLSEVATKTMRVDVWFADDLAYQNVKDSLYLDLCNLSDEPIKVSEISNQEYHEENDCRLTLWVIIPLSSQVQNGDWVEIYGTTPLGHTFSAREELVEKPAIPAITNSYPLIENKDIVGWKIEWDNGEGYLYGQSMEVLNLNDDFNYGESDIPQGTYHYEFRKTGGIKSEDKISFRLKTHAQGYSTVEHVIQVPGLKIEDKTVSKGEYFELGIIAERLENIGGMSLVFEYDENKIIPDDRYSDIEDLLTITASDITSYMKIISLENGKLVVDLAFDNGVNLNGEFAKIKFKAKDEAGTYNISFGSDTDIRDKDLNPSYIDKSDIGEIEVIDSVADSSYLEIQDKSVSRWQHFDLKIYAGNISNVNGFSLKIKYDTNYLMVDDFNGTDSIVELLSEISSGLKIVDLTPGEITVDVALDNQQILNGHIMNLKMKSGENTGNTDVIVEAGTEFLDGDFITISIDKIENGNISIY